MEQQDVIKQLRNLVPKNGVVFNEKIDFPEILCKPKLLPLKSITIRTKFAKSKRLIDK